MLQNKTLYVNKSFVLSQFKASLFIFSPKGMIQCDMQLNKKYLFLCEQNSQNKARSTSVNIVFSWVRSECWS